VIAQLGYPAGALQARSFVHAPQHIASHRDLVVSKLERASLKSKEILLKDLDRRIISLRAYIDEQVHARSEILICMRSASTST